MFFPPMAVTMPARAFEALLQYKGTRLAWFQSHTCPCTAGGADAQGGYRSPGTADPTCQTCRGFGTYWDAPIGPFSGLLTYFASAPSPIEPGIRQDEKFGLHVDTEPVVTIPRASPLNIAGAPAAQQLESVWQNASLKDMFCEIDAVTRYSTLLYQGNQQILPFQQNLSVAATGAVTVYDPATHMKVPVEGYTVQGAEVILPPGFPDGTGYAVEFSAAPLFVAFRPAGAFPHARPFGGSNDTELLPKRFHIQTLDYWTRLNISGTVTSFPAVGGGCC